MLLKFDCSDEQIREFFGAPDNTPIISTGDVFDNTKDLFYKCRFFIKKYYDIDYHSVGFVCYIITSEYSYVRQNINEEKPTSIKFTSFMSSAEILEYFTNVRICFTKKGVTHRINKPAILAYRKGLLYEEKFYRNGIPHNIYGPAVRIYRGDKWCNRFFINGKEFSLSQYLDYLSKRKN